MVYPEKQMDISPEEEKPKTVELIWRVLSEGEFLDVLDYTIEQTALQSATGITGATELIQSDQPRYQTSRGELLSLLSQYGQKLRTELEAIKLLLAQRMKNPTALLPLDETTYPQPIFPLEHILREEKNNRLIR